MVPAKPDVTRGKRWRRFEALAFLALAASILFVQLMVPPIIGLADNGDFARVAGLFSIGVPPNVARLNYFAFIVREYDISPAHYFNSGFLTSAVLPIGLADLANRIFNASSRFDIRFAGAIHSLLFLTALALFAAGTDSWGLAQRVVTRLLAILIFTDVSYAAFFNSFYSEPSSMVFLLIALSAAILAWSREPPGRTMVFVAVVAAILFVLAKPQNVLAGAALAIVCWRAGSDPKVEIRTLCRAGAIGLLVMSLAGYVTTSRGIREATYYVAVFSELLPHSPNPAADADELGLDPSLLRYAGTNPWSPGAPSENDRAFRMAFLERINFRKLLSFYAHHPARLWDLLNREAKSTLDRRPLLGNFERRPGLMPGAQTTSHWRRT